MIKCMLVATLIASLIFLIIDVIWLSFATKSFYRPLIGNLLTDKPVMLAAALFYIIYVMGMSLVVIQPCIDSSNIMKAIYSGFIFGLVKRGDYIPFGPFICCSIFLVSVSFKGKELDLFHD